MKQLFGLTTGQRFPRSDRTTHLEIGPGRCAGRHGRSSPLSSADFCGGIGDEKIAFV